MSEDDANLNEEEIGFLNLSSENIKVGVSYSQSEALFSIWYKNENMIEPHYMSIADTKALISLLKLAVSKAKLEG